MNDEHRKFWEHAEKVKAGEASPSRKPFGMSQSHATVRAMEAAMLAAAAVHIPLSDGPSHNMHGHARRETLDGYQRGDKGTIRRELARRGRNDPCLCGCGRKVKLCPRKQ